MTVMEEMEMVEMVILAEAIPVAGEMVLVVMKTIMAALAEVILVAPVHPVAVSQLWTLKKEGKLQGWEDELHMAGMVEAIMVAHAVAIPDAQKEVIPDAQEEVIPIAQGALHPPVTGEGVHRIVRVVLVRQGVDLLQCPKKK